MGSTTIAVDTLERLAVQLAGIQEAAKQLREIGSFQDAVASLTAERDQLMKAVTDARARYASELETHKRAVEDVKLEASVTIDEAETTLRDAKRQAAEIVAAAKQQAEQDLQADKDNRETILQGLQERIDAEQKTLAELLEYVKDTHEKADEAEARVNAAHASLAKVQAQARQLIGG